MSQRRQNAHDLSDVPDTLPEFLHAFFWDTNPKRVSPRRHMNAVCLRLMEHGDESAIRWLLRTYRRERLRAWIMAREGRGLTPRSLRFWEVLLDLPHRTVTRWIRSRPNLWTPGSTNPPSRNA